ncbi:triose-phosphate isomerase [Variovorax sp. PAMC 28711]|uniref:triose-phosphate isomerase n=1 Tax=Variovorax sp. PAMC 28711 TaxID=1795631 RepID=UPI000AE027F7|nr:triose-phosphate isomerase [Variovorax sp. PAMC 28711]
MTRPLIVGNWKMHGLTAQLADIEALGMAMTGRPAQADVLICPPFTLIERAARIAGSLVAIGAQNCHHETSGTWTGEISARMLKDSGASAVIVGHSERRQHQGETSERVAAKANAAVTAGLLAIICVGETQAERAGGGALAACAAQLALSMPKGIAASAFAIGYEPLWAIGSGQVPTAAQITEMHGHIRQCLVARLGASGNAVRIVYGGSVKPANARSILALSDVGGVLVGGASLKPDEFEAIVRAAAP